MEVLDAVANVLLALGPVRRNRVNPPQDGAEPQLQLVPDTSTWQIRVSAQTFLIHKLQQPPSEKAVKYNHLTIIVSTAQLKGNYRSSSCELLNICPLLSKSPNPIDFMLMESSSARVSDHVPRDTGHKMGVATIFHYGCVN